jgi:hypothetical protein
MDGWTHHPEAAAAASSLALWSNVAHPDACRRTGVVGRTVW